VYRSLRRNTTSRTVVVGSSTFLPNRSYHNSPKDRANNSLECREELRVHQVVSELSLLGEFRSPTAARPASSPPTARTPLAPSPPSRSPSASPAPPTRPSSCPPTSRPSGRGRVAPAARPWNGGAAGVIRARIVAVGRRRTVTCTYSQQLVLLYPTCCVFFASFCTTTPSCRAPAPATTTGTVATAAAGGTPAEALVATVPEPQHARQLHPNVFYLIQVM